jgi:hypothetical protein
MLHLFQRKRRETSHDIVSKPGYHQQKESTSESGKERIELNPQRDLRIDPKQMESRKPAVNHILAVF